jgi:hypothetical protein
MKRVFTILLLLATSFFGTLVFAEGNEPSQPVEALVGTSLSSALIQSVGVGVRRRRARRMRRRARRRTRRRMRRRKRRRNRRMRRNRLRFRGGIGRTRR